jgi:copper chaperone CopZ
MTTSGFKIFVFCLLSILGAGRAEAQFQKAGLGINGLTCSQCSRSVEMQLRKLSFVQDVRMDLEHTEGVITFKENKPVNIKAIAQAVKDAGFSLRYLDADIKMEGIEIAENGCFQLYGDAYYMLRGTAKDKTALKLRFLGKDFMPKSELKRYKLPVQGTCKGKTVYYTTISAN